MRLRNQISVRFKSYNMILFYAQWLQHTENSENDVDELTSTNHNVAIEIVGCFYQKH